jgi:hypothetical protein
VKAPHHGSKKGLGKSWSTLASPAREKAPIIVISAAGRHPHPDVEFVSQLRQQIPDSKFFCTGCCTYAGTHAAAQTSTAQPRVMQSLPPAARNELMAMSKPPRVLSAEFEGDIRLRLFDDGRVSSDPKCARPTQCTRGSVLCQFEKE